MTRIGWEALFQLWWPCTASFIWNIKLGGATITDLPVYSWYRSTIWSPGLGVEFKTFCDKSVASPLAFILGRCLSTLPVEQEILPSDNYGTASLVEVVLCTWAGRRQLSTPTLTYLLTCDVLNCVSCTTTAATISRFFLQMPTVVALSINQIKLIKISPKRGDGREAGVLPRLTSRLREAS